MHEAAITHIIQLDIRIILNFFLPQLLYLMNNADAHILLFIVTCMREIVEYAGRYLNLLSIVNVPLSRVFITASV